MITPQPEHRSELKKIVDARLAINSKDALALAIKEILPTMQEGQIQKMLSELRAEGYLSISRQTTDSKTTEAIKRSLEIIAYGIVSAKNPALETISTIGTRAIPILQEFLIGSDPKLRAAAEAALIRIGAPAVESLVMNPKTPPQAIAQIGQSAVPVLLSLLDGPEQEKASAALMLIGAPAVPTLAQALESSSRSARRVIVMTLWESRTPESFEIMRRHLRTEVDREVRTWLACALAKNGDAASVPALIEALSLKNGGDLCACEALGQLGSAAQTAIPALINSLQDRDLSVQAAAGTALSRLGKPAVPALVKVLRSQSGGKRSACNALGLMAPLSAEALPDLVAVLNDPTSSIQRDSAVALSRFGAAGTQALIDTVINRSEGRVAACEALGPLGPSGKDAVPVLIKALRDPDDKLRLAAAKALGEIGDPAAISPLKRCLKGVLFGALGMEKDYFVRQAMHSSQEKLEGARKLAKMRAKESKKGDSSL